MAVAIYEDWLVEEECDGSWCDDDGGELLAIVDTEASRPEGGEPIVIVIVDGVCGIDVGRYM